MAEPSEERFEQPALDALQWLAKALGQISLYKLGHPSVAAALRSAQERLHAALAQTGGELTFTVDQGKWLANGRIIGATSRTPQSLAALFNRFKLASITFKAGVTNMELDAFCELAAMRPDAAQAVAPKSYLEGRGVSHIACNEEIYAKMGKTAAAGGAAAGSLGGQGGGGFGGMPGLASEGATLDGAIQTLVDKAVPDPALRAKVIERVMELVQVDIQRHVEEVTRNIQQEKNVLQNEQFRTQAVLGNMVEGVVVVDEQGKILMMNPAAERVYGVTLAQAAGKHLSETAGEEHMVTLAAELATAPGDRDIRRDVATTAVDDTKRTLRSAGAVVQNEAGRVVGMVSSLPDVAKHKELLRMQSDFVAHITHELRAPLSSIRAALELLEGEFSGKLQADGAKMLSTAMRNSDRLAEMINSILDFSKIESGQMAVAPRRTNPEKIIRAAVESIMPWASKKQLGLAFSVAPGLPPVLADEKRTIQVLINLLSNAIKFTPAGGRVTVGLAQSQQGSGKSLEFSVADTGPGIAKENQEKIFEKFVQIAAGDASAAGTGLGLSIAKALVHLQGGRLWVDSDVGRGATFAFTIPIYVSSEDGGPAPAAAAPRRWWNKFFRLK